MYSTVLMSDRGLPGCEILIGLNIEASRWRHNSSRKWSAIIEVNANGGHEKHTRYRGNVRANETKE